ncbi:MAG: DNA repair protein RecO [Pseudomonadota bacterium]
MEWKDDAILLSARPHGESAAIVEVLTPAHGRHAGVVRGGTSRKMTPHLQPGAQLTVEWRARLEEHIGAFRVEPVRSRAAALMSDRAALAALTSVCTLLRNAMPEREPVGDLYEATHSLLDDLGGEGWMVAYVRWELFLLTELGYGLDLSTCAATGGREDLCYVSPRSGRAVSRAGAGAWADKLLPLPRFLREEATASDQDIADGLRLTGFFLRDWLATALGTPRLAEARDAAATAMIRQLAAVSGSTGG